MAAGVPASASAPRTGNLMSLDVSRYEAMFRPRLDSDELVYLRQRTLDLDEALLQASQHEDVACLFASASPPLGAARGASRLRPEGADTPDGMAVRGADQSPQHKRRATPSSTGHAAEGDTAHRRPLDVDDGEEDAGGGGRKACGGDTAGAPFRPERHVVSELQKEQMLIAAKQLVDEHRQAQLAAWAAASAGAGTSAGGGEEAQREPGDCEDGWSPVRGAALAGTGRVLFG